MLSVPLSPVPSQTLQVVLDGQNVQLSVYQLPTKTYLPGAGYVGDAPLFMDVSLGGVAVATCRSCLNGVRVLLDEQYSDFVGDFVIVDTQGDTDPVYTGLGTRYQLVYMEASDLGESSTGTVITPTPPAPLPPTNPAIYYPVTPAELAAGVTPLNYGYSAGNVVRYGADPTGFNDSTVAFAAAIAVASQNLGPMVWIPAGQFKISSTLNIASGKQVNIQGAGKFLSILYGTGFGSDVPVISYNGTGAGSASIDSIGCRGFAIWSNNNLARGITASWTTNSAFDDLYFYDCYNGWVGYTAFGNKFRNNNAYNITNASYILSTYAGANAGCSNSLFEGVRMVGNVGCAVNTATDSLAFIGCDIEGIIGNGAGLALVPPTGCVVSNVVVMGSHIENINGTAIYCAGVDANSVTGLVVKGNIIKGGFGDSANPYAVNAIQLYHVNGFDISGNNFIDWGTDDATGGGTQGYACYYMSTASNGVIENNTSAQSTIGGTVKRTVQNLCDVLPAASVRIANNWAPVNGTGYLGYTVNYTNSNEVTLPYSSTIAVDASTGGLFDITATNNTGFTISNPTNGFKGKTITFKIRNTSGGALGAVTWMSSFKMSTWTSPANAYSRSVTFCFDGTYWIQISQTGVDVPN